MFDRLVESDTTGAEFKNRGRYFMISTIVVGTLFLTAVVYSLYAAEIGLGSGNFEIAELISPVASDIPQPAQAEPVANQPSSSTRNVDSHVAIIEDLRNVPSLENSGEKAPRSYSPGKFDPLKPFSLGNGGPTAQSGSPTGTGTSNDRTESDVPDTRTVEPPPAIKTVPKPKPVVSEGVINGKATFLPVPQYPPPAKAVNAYGTVNVQVTIDEAGNVVSAKAASGHPLLQQAAERAAKQAKFSPTYLSRVPVKVTGIIVYNFKRN